MASHGRHASYPDLPIRALDLWWLTGQYALVRTGRSSLRSECMVPLAAALAGLLSAGCSGDGAGRIGILQIQVGGERELVLGIDACDANAKAAVIGSSNKQVVVRVVGSRSNQDDCSDGVTLCLEDDLAGRTVLDDTSGQLFTSTPVGPSSGRCGS